MATKQGLANWLSYWQDLYGTGSMTADRGDGTGWIGRKSMSLQRLIGKNGLSRRRSVRFAAALLVGTAMAACAITPAHAQESNASLQGTVKADGGVSQVTVIDVNSGLTRTVTVGPNGTYIFGSLRPGTYRLELTTPGGVRRTDEFTLLVA
ncbi:MAG: carboxypeptidase-like regulatory domain-containing protein, partial [Burkholderiales bacterium]